MTNSLPLYALFFNILPYYAFHSFTKNRILAPFWAKILPSYALYSCQVMLLVADGLISGAFIPSMKTSDDRLYRERPISPFYYLYFLLFYIPPDNTPQQQKRQISEPTEMTVDQLKQPAGSTQRTKRHCRAVILGTKNLYCYHMVAFLALHLLPHGSVLGHLRGFWGG
jgi:hypothetical protein